VCIRIMTNDVYKSSCFSGDGSVFLSISADGKLAAWETSSKQPLKLPQDVATIAFSCCSVSNDGAMAVAGAESGSIYRLDLQLGEATLISKQLQHGARVTAIALHPIEPKAYSCGEDYNVYEWNLENGKVSR
jgi:WD40 repeat protein